MLCPKICQIRLRNVIFLPPVQLEEKSVYIIKSFVFDRRDQRMQQKSAFAQTLTLISEGFRLKNRALRSLYLRQAANATLYSIFRLRHWSLKNLEKLR
jgi:hypothetical protein